MSDVTVNANSVGIHVSAKKAASLTIHNGSEIISTNDSGVAIGNSSTIEIGSITIGLK